MKGDIEHYTLWRCSMSKIQWITTFLHSLSHLASAMIRQNETFARIWMVRRSQLANLIDRFDYWETKSSNLHSEWHYRAFLQFTTNSERWDALWAWTFGCVLGFWIRFRFPGLPQSFLSRPKSWNYEIDRVVRFWFIWEGLWLKKFKLGTANIDQLDKIEIKRKRIIGRGDGHEKLFEGDWRCWGGKGRPRFTD